MSVISDLMQANLFDVFNERDRELRRAAAVRTYAEDVVFHDPEGSVTGRAAVEAKAGELLDGAPGFVFRAAGPVSESADLGVLAWEFGPEGQAAVASGIDVALVRDGRVATLHTMLTDAPA